jgi:succinate dehydrogenase / fumarate reductase iron-sulfur subunit
MTMAVTFRIFRFNPETDNHPRYQEFAVETCPGWTVLDSLRHIKDTQDGSLAFRRSCRHGICGSCGMTINGVNRLACETQVSAFPSKKIEVEPLRSFPVLRDLVTDMTPFYDRYERIMPYLVERKSPPTDRERLQSPEDRAKLDGAYECILCGCCTSSCPSFWADKQFLGPAALLKAYRFVFDSRDQDPGERLRIVNDKHGLWRCHTIFNCVEACPKSLNPTAAIAELKRAVVRQTV